MTTFTVNAQRGHRRWVLQCVEHPGALSEVARLSEAEDAIREAIAYVAGLAEDSFAITVIPTIDSSVRKNLDAAAALREQAAEASAQASEEMVQAAQTLSDAGLSLRDIGTVMGLSHQRVDQLLKSAEPVRRAR